jgi:hypothetical protein
MYEGEEGGFYHQTPENGAWVNATVAIRPEKGSLRLEKDAGGYMEAGECCAWERVQPSYMIR